MHSKKAEVSPVFKYILALIVGVMFISFFVGFAVQHKAGQTKLETGRIVYGFDDLLTLFSTSGEASMVYPDQGFPSAVELNIKDGKISSGTIAKQTTKIVFSQSTLKGQKFYIWTKRWKMPFIVDNFFYLADGRVMTYVIYDLGTKELADELTDKYEGFPKTFNVDKYNVEQLDAKATSALKSKSANYAKTRFVVLSSKKPDIKGFRNAELLIIKPAEIEGGASWDYGTAEFPDGESYYAGKEMLIGAILTDNKKTYEASKERAMEKLSIMASLYVKKAQLLESTCPAAYTLIKQALSSLAAAEPTKGALDKFNSQVQGLKELNRQFETGCPEVF